jgi:hypothetical protein
MEEFSLAVLIFWILYTYDYTEHVDRLGGTWFLTVKSVQLGAFIPQKTSVPTTFYVTKHAKYAMYAVSSREAQAYIGGKQTCIF